MEPLYSVRMRAAEGGAHEHGGRHLSGAERLVPEAAVEETVLQLLRRARSRGLSPDFVRITVDRLSPEAIVSIPGLPVTTVHPADTGQATLLATRLLTESGVAAAAVDAAFSGLRKGWLSHGALRGAVLLDATTGRRLDADPLRGVRVSRLDYSPAALRELESRLQAHELGHFRVREALAIASKVLWSGAIAELCWSDDPDYTTGYVATPARGYVRLSDFKPPGAIGGRAFFIRSDASPAELEQLIRRLERDPVWIDTPAVVHPPVSGSEFS